MTEIEVKARIIDKNSTYTVLKTCTKYTHLFCKSDTYWSKPDFGYGSGVRIRRLDEKNPGAVVTWKKKELRGDTEVNSEHEFEVSSSADFEALLQELGFAPHIRKKKSGTAWELDDILVELCDIEGLGTFIELEILLDNPTEIEVEAARQRLFAALRTLGVDEAAIERRYYTEMLREAGLGSIKSV